MFIPESEDGSFYCPPAQFLPLISPVSFMLSSSQPSRKIETVDISQVPTLSHPNSPYVPWTDSERNRPMSPVSIYSRSGARAPEPPESLVSYSRSRTAILRLSQSLKDLRLAMKRNVFHAARRIKCSFSPRIEATCVIPTPTTHTQSPTASFDSTNTTSLAAWLSARQRQIAEEYDPNVLMTLEEYERVGSWLNVLDGCGHAGCEMHSSDDDDDKTKTTETSILRLLEPATSLHSL